MSAHDFGERRTIDLSRLNEAERRVLRLLAEGHTAKSIATLIGSTPAAVNERLREARRKTEVGSSRELARLLKAQENRHEQIGVGRDSMPAAGFSHPAATPWRSQTGVLAMVAVVLVTLAGAALLSQASPDQPIAAPVAEKVDRPLAAPAADNQVDPLVGQAIERFPQPADLHAKVRAEQRDTAWAPQMEAAIQARLMSLPLVGKDGNALRVTCGATLCEIAGTLLTPSKEERADQNSQFSRTVNSLQVPPLTDDLMHLGLKVESGSFTSAKGKPDRMVFLLYYSRAAK